MKELISEAKYNSYDYSRKLLDPSDNLKDHLVIIDKFRDIWFWLSTLNQKGKFNTFFLEKRCVYVDISFHFDRLDPLLGQMI